MRRFTTLAALAMGAVLALAGPSEAKGPGFENQTPVSGTVSVDGPGLDQPIHRTWHGDCLIYCMRLRRPNGFVQLATGAGILGFQGSVLRTTPPRGELGPRFDVAFTVTYR